MGKIALSKKPKTQVVKHLEACIDGRDNIFILVNPPKNIHPQKWGLPFTNYFFILTLNLILFLVERGSSIDTTNFFFLALTGFFGVVVLSLVVGLSSSMAASTNTCKFLWDTSS
jgi:hypothetical protein